MNVVVWPIRALWVLVTGILTVTGRLVAIVIGLVLIIVGMVFNATIIGAIVGVPLMLIGALLLVRGLF